MSARATPPADFDEYALDMARRVASIDRARLPGSTTQFIAVIQTTIIDAMMFAAAYAREPHVTVKGNCITMSPAMPMADHEMDVLRSIASRLKPGASDFRNFASSSTAFVRDLGDSSTNDARTWTEPVEETKPC